MIAILGTFDLSCGESNCNGEVIATHKSITVVRQQALRREDGKIIRTFGTKEEALAYAKRAGLEVRE
jgi:hypothetical protein